MTTIQHINKLKIPRIHNNITYIYIYITKNNSLLRKMLNSAHDLYNYLAFSPNSESQTEEDSFEY